MIKGKVVNSYNEPIPNVNIYISQTKIGSTTNELGLFKIANIPFSNFYLVVSCVGYQTRVVNIELNKNTLEFLNIRLDFINYQVEEIVVQGQFSDLWQKQLTIFKDLLLGFNDFANSCEIINPFKLEFEENDKELKATIDEPLIIINNALGYKIECFLKSFCFYKKEQQIIYEIYPRFNEIIVKSIDSLKLFVSNRIDIFNGSLANFLSSLIGDEYKFREEGFEVSYFNSMAPVENSSEIVSYDSSKNKYYLCPDNKVYNNFIKKNKGINVKYWKQGKRSFSQIKINAKNGAEFSPTGFFIKPKEINVYGDFAKEGIATMLPLY